MALVKCVECGNEFSDKAKACPKCACPFETSEVENTPKDSSKVQTVELTSKNLKVQIIYAVILMLFSFLFLMFGLPVVWGLLFFGAIIWLLIVRVNIWWHHK